MARFMKLEAGTVLLTVTSTHEAVFLALAIEREVAEEHRDGVHESRLRPFVDMAQELRRLVPSAEVAAEVSADSASVAGGWTTQEAATHLGAAGVRGGPRWVRQLLREGVLTGAQVGREWRVDAESLAAYIDERKAA